MIEFANKNPFHPESQLVFLIIPLLFKVLAEYLMLKAEFSNATEFLERCILSFECAFNYKFKILTDTPNTRLQLESNQLNLYFSYILFIKLRCRLFCTAIFKYIDILSRKGCNRTALELTKLLLSFFPQNDSFGALLFIDYYALRSKQVFRK
jgi:hypothetical protein